MKTRIKKISPLQTGKVLAVVHALFGVVMLPILLLAAIYGPGFCPDFCPEGSRSIHLLLAVVIPLVYVAGGFFGGIICAIVYNLVARWVGGMEVEFEEQGS